MVISSFEGALIMAKAQRSTVALDRVEVELLQWLEVALDGVDGR